MDLQEFFAAVVTVCNLCIGLGILAKPYAFALSGVGLLGNVLFMLVALVLNFLVALAVGSLSKAYLKQKRSRSLQKVTEMAGTQSATSIESQLVGYQPQTSSKMNYGSTLNHHDHPHHSTLLESEDTLIQHGTHYHYEQQRQPSVNLSYVILAEFSVGRRFGRPLAVAAQLIAVVGFLIQSLVKCNVLLSQVIRTADSDSIKWDLLTFVITLMIFTPASLTSRWSEFALLGYISTSFLFLTVLLFVILASSKIGILSKFNGIDESRHLCHIDNAGNDYSIQNTNTNIAGIAKSEMNGMESVLMAINLCLFGVSGAFSLPMVYQQLDNQDDYNQAVLAAYFMVSVLYTILGAAGKVIYGHCTNVVIIVNLYEWPGSLALADLVSVMLIMNVACSSGFCSWTISSMLTDDCGLIWFARYRRLSQLTIVLICGMVGFAMRNRIAFVIFANSVIAVLTFVLFLPVLFYVFAFWKEMSFEDRLLSVIFMAGSLGLAGLVFYTDVQSIY